MLRFEIKKVFSKRMNQLAMLILLAIVLIGSFLTINDVKYIEADGTTISGILAGRKLKKAQNAWKGELTEEVLREIQTINSEINAEAKASGISPDTIEYDKVAAKKQGFQEISDMIGRAFVEFDGFDYFRSDSVGEDEVGALYERRISSLKEYLEREDIKNTISEKEKEYLINQWESLKTPFHYEYAGGWKAILDSQYVPTLMTILAVILGFLVAGIFSDEFQLRADSIFFSARHGRDKAVLAKVGAGVCIATIVYWGTVLLYSLLVLGALGFGGASCPVQCGYSSWNSIYNFTYIQDYLFTTIGGYVGSMAILLTEMFVSAKSRSTAIAIVVPIVLACVPMFLGRIPMFSRIITFFPDALLRINVYLDEFWLCEIGGNVTGLFTFLIPPYLAFCVAGAPVLYQVYKKVEVK